MKKLFTIITFSCCFFNSAQSQTCDTSKYDEAIAAAWSAITYNSPNPFNEPGYGYTNGVDWLKNKEVANYFDLSATSYNFILGALIKFGKANSNRSESLSKLLYFKVYEDLNNKPGKLLATVERPLSEIKTNVDQGRLTPVNFPAGIPMPASKKFYLSVNISNFRWQNSGQGQKDSIWIAGTADNEIPGNTAWSLDEDSVWTAFPDAYYVAPNLNNPLEINLWMFPYVSTSSAGCGLLPVDLLSFTAARNNNDVTLKWEVSNEINMKGYSIEKAGNNGVYQGISFILAANSLKNQTYTATDKDAFSTSSTVQYRLKQVNIDGSAVYSRIISLNHNAALTDAVFQNPFTGVLKMQVTLAAAQKVGLQLYDMQGRLVVAQQPQSYAAGTNTIILANTTNIKPGTYLLKLNAGNEQMVYKVVKQ